jgi:hypothetical protein
MDELEAAMKGYAKLDLEVKAALGSLEATQQKRAVAAQIGDNTQVVSFRSSQSMIDRESRTTQ